jgi:RHS repeat-associated protein
MDWKQDSQTRKYTYAYDNLSRLKTAVYTGIGSEQYNTSYSYDKHGNMLTLQRYGKKDAGSGSTSFGLVDNLTMTYNGNQLTKVSDAVANFAYPESADFKNYGGTNSAYTYNKNGAMASDSHKGILGIKYNSLNLPQELAVKNINAVGKTYYLYSAGGQKLQTVHKSTTNMAYTPVVGSTSGDSNFNVTTTTDYVGNKVYENGTLKRILVDGGYIEVTKVSGVNQYAYYFYQTDHLGNNRVVANQGGTAIQKNHYYPFGTAFADKYDDGKNQPYKYNGKELDQMHGLNLYDYSARYYESAIGRFTTVDPHAENYYSWSPYVYVGNNPMRITDPTGMDWWSTNNPDEIERVLAALKAGEKVNTKSFGEDWTRVTDKEVLDAKAKGVFDDVSLDLTIDGQSWKDFNGYGVKNNLDLGIGLMSLGSATIWSKYASDMELSQLGKFRLGNKIYSQLYLGGKIHSSALIKGSKASFLSGVKLGGYAKLGGTVLSGISVFSTSIDLIQAYKKEDPAAMFESNFDAFMTGVGFVGPVGAGVSAYWSVTKPLRKKWAEQVLLPYLKTTNGIVYPAFFPFK